MKTNKRFLGKMRTNKNDPNHELSAIKFLQLLFYISFAFNISFLITIIIFIYYTIGG